MKPRTLQLSDQVGNQVNGLIINSLEELIAFCNQVSNQESVEVSDQVSDQVIHILNDQFGNHVDEILSIVAKKPFSSTDILEKIGLTKHTKNKKKYIDPLLDIGWIQYTIPDNPKDRNQKYKLSESGKKLMNLIKIT